MRVETVAVTRGLELLTSASDAPVAILCTDSQSLLRKLQAGTSPEWHSLDRYVIWVYCPGHAGITLNERADHLAEHAPAGDCISLDAKDILYVTKHLQRVGREAGEPDAEMQRMREHRLARGWAARFEAGGCGAQLMCQLVTGTLSASSFRRVLIVGAEAAWDRIFGLRQSVMPPDRQ